MKDSSGKHYPSNTICPVRCGLTGGCTKCRPYMSPIEMMQESQDELDKAYGINKTLEKIQTVEEFFTEGDICVDDFLTTPTSKRFLREKVRVLIKTAEARGRAGGWRTGVASVHAFWLEDPLKAEKQIRTLPEAYKSTEEIKEEAVRKAEGRAYKLAHYTEHQATCFLYTAEHDEYDNKKCTCGLSDLFTPTDVTDTHE